MTTTPQGHSRHWDAGLDPDAELRTIPSGWDLSHAAQRASSTSQPANHVVLPAAGDAASTTWQDEKFTEPNTTPRNWDVNNLR